MFNRAYNFALVNQPNVSLQMFPNQEEVSAGKMSLSSGKSMKEAEQVVRKKILSRLQKEGAEGARIVPVD